TLKNRVPTFGSRIKNLRESKSLSLRECARRLGVSATYLSNVERDLLPPPTEERIRRLANVLDVDSAQLIDFSGRVPAEVGEAIRRDPAVAALIRLVCRLSHEERLRLLQHYGNVAFAVTGGEEA